MADANEGFNIADYADAYDARLRTGLCKACKRPVGWSRIKVAQHYRACLYATPEQKEFFKNYPRKRPASIAFVPSNESQSAMDVSESVTSSVGEPMSNERRKEIDKLCANFFYTTGVSFRVVESFSFKAFVTALNSDYASRMPTRQRVAGSLLDESYLEVKKEVDEILRTASNLVLISDGWTNINKCHLVNFCIRAPNFKTFFYSSIDTSAISQTGENIAQEILKIIDEIGAMKFTGVITDNAFNMQKAWDIIERERPHISANGCASHTLNLLLKDIVEKLELHETIAQGMSIVKFLTNHTMINCKFEELRKSLGISHKLSLPVETRWFSKFTFASNLLKCKYVIKQFVGEEKDMCESQKGRGASEALTLINSDDFWDSLSELVNLIEYPTEIIGKLEREDAFIPLVYHHFGNLYQYYKDKPEVQQLVKERWDFIYTESIGLSYMLSPAFAFDGFYVDDDESKIPLHLKKFFMVHEHDKYEKAKNELRAFIDDMGATQEELKEWIFVMTAKSYWSTIGKNKYPNLSIAAQRIVGIISSSASSERSWSLHRFIHSRLRNRLKTDRVEKLIFLYSNSSTIPQNQIENFYLENSALFEEADFDMA